MSDIQQEEDMEAALESSPVEDAAVIEKGDNAPSASGEHRGFSRRPYDKTRRGDYKGDRNDEKRPGKLFFQKKRVCRFCTQKIKVNYKEPDSLRRFVSERGKILPRRITGNCARHQRIVTAEVKKARVLALLPFVARV